MMRNIKIFYSYAPEDRVLRDELEKHLRPLKRQGYITEWHDQAIQAGLTWKKEFDTHLGTSDLILLLISPDFIASDRHWNTEVLQALKRHRAGDCRIVPIILRPIDWKSTPLGELQALPLGGKPITTCSNQDEALEEVAKGLREIVMSLLVVQHNPQKLYAQILQTSPTFFDPLNGQTPRLWYEQEPFSFLQKGEYHVCVQGNNIFGVGFAQGINLQDFAFQVEMILLEGTGGGMLLRTGEGSDPFGARKYDPFGYRFSLHRNGYNVVYGADIVHPREATFRAEPHHSYLLTAIALGNNLSLYINKKYLVTITDNHASSGGIGLLAWNDDKYNQANVVYRNARVWNLLNTPL